MLKIKRKQSMKEWVLVTVFYLLLFQSPLESIIPLCTYIDETFPLLGAVYFAYRAVKSGRIRLKKSSAKIVALMVVFLWSGLMGNLVYQYQPTWAVLTDLYVNLKFSLSMLTGYILFSTCYTGEERTAILRHVRLASVMLFALLVADYLFHIFPSPESRYGIRVEQLFYYHPTYLAAAAVFLLALLTVFYERSNKAYIVCALCVLISTLRGKAMAGAAVYVLIHYFLIEKKRKLKLRHVVLLLLVVAFIGRDLFSYYYIDVDAGQSARRELTITSFQIMGDYFPIGTGFGTYGSAVAAEYYSPVYYKYGLNYVWGLSETFRSFACDTFWPIIIGQTGVIGLVCYASTLIILFFRILRLRKIDLYAYAAGVFIMVYLAISSTSEVAFNNAISVPLAMVLGSVFEKESHTNLVA